LEAALLLSHRGYYLDVRAALAGAAFAAAAFSVSCSPRDSAQPRGLHAVLETASVADDADDPAIWVDRAHPERSLIVGTNKVAAPDGALYVFGLDGTVRQVVKPLDRPNNVDVEYGLAAPNGVVDIIVATERLQGRLRIYGIAENGLTPIDDGGIRVLDGQPAEAGMPMGIALYKRASDGAIFAIVAPKTGGQTNYLWQYRLTFDPLSESVQGTLVRRFGNFSGVGEIEAVAVDDALGYVYYADEEFGIRKWHADPDHPDAATELAVFGREGFTLQREGIAIVGKPDGTGFIICNDQIEGASVLHIFRREGEPGRPHDHGVGVILVPTEADNTDGIDATATALGPTFERGLLAMMNSRGRNFQFYDLGELVEMAARINVTP
jgi:3-phytase